MDQTSFLSGPNAPFIEELYAKYLQNAASVDPTWRTFFEDLRDDAATVLQDIRGASWAPRERDVEIANGHDEEIAGTATATAQPRSTARDRQKAALDSLRAMMLIRAYRVRGHLEASLDPLELKPRGKHAELDPRTYGFAEADMD